MKRALVLSLLLTIAFFTFGAEGQTVDINELTLEQLKTIRPDLVQIIRAGEDENTASSQVKKDKHGRTKRYTEETKGIDGAVISKRVDDYVYYPSGCIDTIEMKVYDGGGSLVSKKVVKHFEDGKQPIVTK